MSNVLLIIKANWADEMDLTSLQVWNSKTWNDYKNSMPERDFNIYVGSNQEYTASKSEILKSVTEVEISEEQAVFLKNVVFAYHYANGDSYPTNNFGFDLLPQWDDEDDDED